MRGAPFFQEKERGPSRSPPKKAAWGFLFRRARARRNGAAGAGRRLFARGSLLSGERRPPLALPTKESRMGFPVPSRGGRAGTERWVRGGGFLREGAFFQEKEAPSRALPQESRMGFPVPPRGGRAGTERRVRGGGFLREGVFFQEKEDPLSRSSPRKPQGFSCSGAAVKRNARARRPLRAADAGKRLSSGKGVQGENLFFLLKEEVFPLASPHPFATM